MDGLFGKGGKLSCTVGICFGSFSHGCLEKTQFAGPLLFFLRWVGLNLINGICKIKVIYTNPLKEMCAETG